MMSMPKILKARKTNVEYVNKWYHLFHIQTTDLLTVRGRSTLKGGEVNGVYSNMGSFTN